ncbi:hypothetical protein [Sphingomonas sanxanigenens]|uniref:hypothetical protein n=1 Tax=Sphingomonas sanxanigenens TaxID=397260 RepID=UPI001300F271|nr:hypothetical protein [Sphingomonas sanxanigenens]
MATATALPKGSDVSLGACTINPPELIEVGGQSAGCWPRTHEARVCGDWAGYEGSPDPDDGEEVPAADRTIVHASSRFLNRAPPSRRDAAARNSTPGIPAGDSGGVRSPALDAQTRAAVALACVNDGPGSAPGGEAFAAGPFYAVESSEPRTVSDHARCSPAARAHPAGIAPARRVHPRSAGVKS